MAGGRDKRGRGKRGVFGYCDSAGSVACGSLAQMSGGALVRNDGVTEGKNPVLLLLLLPTRWQSGLPCSLDGGGGADRTCGSADMIVAACRSRLTMDVCFAGQAGRREAR